MPNHEWVRVRHNVVRRKLRLIAKQQLTPRMLSLTFHSNQLAGFSSLAFDDHIKIFVPGPLGELVGRDFTPRAFDEKANTLTLDFALHRSGPAVDWAQEAQPGNELEIGGPKGSSVPPSDFAWYLLMGDATALPAIARYLDEAPQTANVQTIALVDGQAEEAYGAQATGALKPIRWLHSTGNQHEDEQLWREALKQLVLPPGDGAVWIAGETNLARLAYRHVVDTMAHPPEWTKAAGYWSAGKANAGERIR